MKPHRKLICRRLKEVRKKFCSLSTRAVVAVVVVDAAAAAVVVVAVIVAATASDLHDN